MATFYNTATDFEPELPHYLQKLVDAEEAEKEQEQQQIQMEEDVAAGKKAGPPSPGYEQQPQDTTELDNLIDQLSDKSEVESEPQSDFI